jgi:hypothetical protein
MSSPLPSPNVDLPLLSGVEAREDKSVNAQLSPRLSNWRRFPFPTPPPRYSSTITSKSNGIKLQSVIRQSYQDFALGVCTTLCCLITLLYACGATWGNPALQGLYKNTSYTVFLLWVLSQLSVFLVGLLISSAFERLRWALASSEKGILLTSFLGMSSTMAWAGMLRLLVFGGENTQGRKIWERVTTKVQWWIIQRFRTDFCQN